MINVENFIKTVHQEYSKHFDRNETSNFEEIFVHVLYLVEWKFLLQYHEKPTDINWLNYGVPLINKNDKILNIVDIEYIGVTGNYTCYDFRLLLITKWIINKILKKNMKLTDIKHLVHCTYPFQVSDKYDKINLTDLSIEYIIKHNISSETEQNLIEELKKN